MQRKDDWDDFESLFRQSRAPEDTTSGTQGTTPARKEQQEDDPLDADAWSRAYRARQQGGARPGETQRPTASAGWRETGTGADAVHPIGAPGERVTPRPAPRTDAPTRRVPPAATPRTAPRAPHTAAQGNARPGANPGARAGSPANSRPASQPGSRPSSRGAATRAPRPVWVLVVTDFLLFAVVLLTFAMFHHVLPRWMGGVEGTGPVQTVSRPDSAASNTVTITDSSGNTVTVDMGAFGAKWPEKFAASAGEIELTDTSYKGTDRNITIEKVQKDGVTYYVADIYVKNIDAYATAFADGKYGQGFTQTTAEMARENNALLAVSGDYYGIRTRGVVIRNGNVYRDDLWRDVCVLYYDGTMQTYTAEEFDINEAIAKGAYQAWSFGPELLTDDGQSMTEFNTDVSPRNPRTAIGYYEPGHYCFVVVDGRQEGYSVGMSMTELSALFEELGCKQAYNLDGGQTSVMWFNGKVVNQPYNGGRRCSDIVYIGKENAQ